MQPSRTVDKYIFAFHFAFFSFNEFNFEHYLIFSNGIPYSTNSSSDGLWPKNLKRRTYDEKNDLEISTRPMTVQVGTERVLVSRFVNLITRFTTVAL